MMHEFLVIVTCLAHLKSCPIPNGFQQYFAAHNKQQCEKQARMVIAGFGLATTDFSVECKEK